MSGICRLRIALLLLFVVSCYCHSIPFLRHFPSHRHAVIQRILGSSYESCDEPSANKSRVFCPTDYGADPMGIRDSSLAIAQTIKAAFDEASTDKDLGGTIIDFAGGEYAVSQPVMFPAGYSDFLLMRGTLRALPNFPAGGTLLQIGATREKSYNIDIERLTLNGSNIVGTALAVESGQYVNIGPAVMISGFERFGITMNGTGGGYIQNSWLGQFSPDDHKDRTKATATAIYLDNGQHDCYVNDVIIWSGRVGVWSRNGANQFQGVHTWNLATKFGGIGIILASGKGRVVNCYLDFNPLIIVDPKGAVVSNTLFLATANIVLLATSGDEVRDLTIANNWWNSENKYMNDTIILDGSFKHIKDTVIETNIADPKWTVKSTRATRSVSINTTTTQVTLDFSSDLLFDTPITEAFCSIQAPEYVGHVIHPLVSTLVTVELSKALHKGVVLCSVDQSARTHAAH